MSENIKNAAAESAQNAAGAAEAVTHDMTAEAVNEPVQADAGVDTHTFKKPFEYAGETYTTLTFDFEKMTGRDMVSIETEMQMNNEYCLAPEVSRSFQAKMAAKAAGNSYPIEVKRRTIRDSIQVHRRLGTKYAVEKALGAVYPGTKVEEWFEYGGDPYKFRVVIGATEAGITADRQAAVLDRVRFYKNLRSHLEAISYQIEKRTAVKVAAVHAIGQRVEVYPYLARNMESHGGFYCGGYTQYGRKLAVFPNK